MLAWVMSACITSHAATGEAVYKATCNSCHDSGAGLALRVTHAEDWTQRWPRGRAALPPSVDAHPVSQVLAPNAAMPARNSRRFSSLILIPLSLFYFLKTDT